MADISLTILSEQKEGEFRAFGSRMDRFREDLLNAINEVLSQINLFADLDTAISYATSLEGTIGIDLLYRYPFSRLLTKRLIEMGQRPAKGHEVTYNDLVKQEATLLDMIRQGILNAIQGDDDDDDDSDRAGLGALG